MKKRTTSFVMLMFLLSVVNVFGEDKAKELKTTFTAVTKASVSTTTEAGAAKEVTEKKKRYTDLDYSVREKKEYPENPRVKVKGLYVSRSTAETSKLMDKLIEIKNTTKINSFVIDFKDDDGIMLFHSKAAEKYAPGANKYVTLKDPAAFMKKLKDNKIYTIARIVTFKDARYTKEHPERTIVYKADGRPFTNADKIRWATPYDRELWKYNVETAKEAASMGFNEIQFDYVRFPASNGGKLDKDLDYRNVKNETKPKAIQEFLKYAYSELSPMKVYTSADVFGLVGSVSDDMGLGQHWEAVSNAVDYICPMMYPSHYANATYGLSVPDAFPYQTIMYSTKDSLKRNKNLQTPSIVRPWIQSFTASWVKGHIRYGEKQVRDQINALKEQGVDEYLIWNAGSKYIPTAFN